MNDIRLQTLKLEIRGNILRYEYPIMPHWYLWASVVMINYCKQAMKPMEWSKALRWRKAEGWRQLAWSGVLSCKACDDAHNSTGHFSGTLDIFDMDLSDFIELLEYFQMTCIWSASHSGEMNRFATLPSNSLRWRNLVNLVVQASTSASGSAKLITGADHQSPAM